MDVTPEKTPGRLLGAIFSASPDAVIVIDESGKILLSSPAITALFGYYPEELVGESVEILIPSDRRTPHAAHLKHFFNSPRARTMGAGLELSGLHRDGAEFPVEISLTPVEISGDRYAAAFVRDGRERQRGIDRLHAINEITQRLLAGDETREILPFITERARDLCRADAVWIVAPAPSGELEVTAVNGPGTDVLLGVALSAKTSRSAEAMRTGHSEVISDLSEATNVPEAVVGLDLGPGVYVPLIADERPLGTLVLGRIHGRQEFGPIDVAFAEVFASATATAIELGEVRSEVERLGIINEDERIARDLHDTVIQHLFAIGMSLQAAQRVATRPVSERIDAAITNLDGVIHEIRNTIFRLPGRTEAATGLRDEMLRVADKFAEELGFTPRVGFHGPVDISVPELVRTELVQVLAEAFSNTARHARASSVEAIVAVEEGWLCFSLVDDGVGISGEPSAGQGLRNMSTRAANLGGTFNVSRREPTGTVVEWRVPI
ncbi:MAG TPA: PAS domain S-box protein [Acidimicrobiales bacterium]